MKTVYIKDVKLNYNTGESVELYGWIRSIRKQKYIFFIDVEDATGMIRLSVDKSIQSFTLKREQSIHCIGKLSTDSKGDVQIIVQKIDLIGDVNILLSPSARSSFDVFSPQNANNIVNNKHLYIRNQKNRSVLMARDLVITAVRKWFRDNGYIDVTAPILTPILLYDTSTGIDVHIKGEDVFLTQCVGFYLESAVHSLERVYNIGPSFRGAESVSKRHLMEYWHIKSEFAFCSFEEYFDVVEDLIRFTTDYVKNNGGLEMAQEMNTIFCDDGLHIPYPRIEYADAIELLNQNGIAISFGKSLNANAENFLSEYFGKPFWIVHKPKEIEGFPYKINENDKRLTETADLIASRGMGEILGIADKITDINMLKSRLTEKGKNEDDYRWFAEIREYGTVPHCGLGMGLERLIRWLFIVPHVKDVIPFPRRINKRIYP